MTRPASGMGMSIQSWIMSGYSCRVTRGAGSAGRKFAQTVGVGVEEIAGAGEDRHRTQAVKGFEQWADFGVVGGVGSGVPAAEFAQVVCAQQRVAADRGRDAGIGEREVQ